MLTRRELLAAAALLAVRRAGAAPAPFDGSTQIEHGAGGVTLWARLRAAPFPVAGERYADDTVGVFVPAYYRAGDGGVDFLVHCHGHHGEAAHIMAKHGLREQLVESGRAAVLVVPQGPFDAEDSSGGRLEQPGGMARLLEAVLDVLGRPEAVKALGPARVRAGAGIGKLCLSAHSGGYRAILAAAQQGGTDAREIWLFDAMWSRHQEFVAWVEERRQKGPDAWHRLVSFHRKNARPADEVQAMLGEPHGLGIAYQFEKKENLQLGRRAFGKARVVVVRTEALHDEVVWANRALWSCLVSSTFTAARKPTSSDPRKP